MSTATYQTLPHDRTECSARLVAFARSRRRIRTTGAAARLRAHRRMCSSSSG
jgi:hypothetical protein